MFSTVLLLVFCANIFGKKLLIKLHTIKNDFLELLLTPKRWHKNLGCKKFKKYIRQNAANVKVCNFCFTFTWILLYRSEKIRILCGVIIEWSSIAQMSSRLSWEILFWKQSLENLPHQFLLLYCILLQNMHFHWVTFFRSFNWNARHWTFKRQSCNRRFFLSVIGKQIEIFSSQSIEISAKNVGAPNVDDDKSQCME